MCRYGPQELAIVKSCPVVHIQLAEAGLIAPLVSRLPQVRLPRLVRPAPGESSLGRCWAAYTMSTSGWLRDPSRYGCNFGTPQVSETDIPTVLEILHRGGKVALRHTEDPTVVIEWKAYGMVVFEMEQNPE